MLKRFNEGVARGEGAIALGMLLLMIVVAFAQAFFRNMTNLGFGWANAALGYIYWADFILSKGTLWLAFLGASMAVFSDQHVAIDALPKLAPARARLIMRGIVGIVGSVICFFLARAFWGAVLINGAEIPGDAEIMTAEGHVHVCDATEAELTASGGQAGFYCVLRSFFSALGLKIEYPGAAFELIAPVMFLFMSVRFAGNGIHEFIKLARGDFGDDSGAHGPSGEAHGLEDEQKGN